MKNGIFSVVLSVATILCPALVNAAGLSSMGQSGVVDNVNKTEQLGVGAQVGSLPGINLEYWATSARAWEASVGVEHSNTSITIGHNWMFRDLFTTEVANYFVPYIGAGALALVGQHEDYLDRTPNGDSFALAAQVPLGIEFLPSSQRFSVFGQIAPSVEITPIAYGFVTGDIGARFYF